MGQGAWSRVRGFPEFIEALPEVLIAHPTLEVEIAGEDRICYGGSAPDAGSYGKWAKTKLNRWVEANRVRFLGRVPPTEYPSWLQRSWMHVHLTRPFVASWSLLEAMASGCCLIASNTEPVREFVGPNSASLVDFRTKEWLNPAVTTLLGDAAFAERSLKPQSRQQSATTNAGRSKHGKSCSYARTLTVLLPS